MEEHFFNDVIDFLAEHAGAMKPWGHLMGYIKQCNGGKLPYSQVAIATKINSARFAARLLAAKLELRFVRSHHGEWCAGSTKTIWPKGESVVVFGPPPPFFKTVMFQGLRLQSSVVAG